MQESACLLLDDYLAHDLTGENRARFVAHLPTCPDCDRAVREQERLSALLREAAALDRVPARLLDRVERRARITRQRRMTVAALAVAATITGIWLVKPRIEPDAPATRGPTLAGGSGSVSPVEPASHVRVSFPVDAHLSAVPIKSESANVTVFWVFSTPERSAR
jgi:anti-sigma factor RsiW